MLPHLIFAPRAGFALVQPDVLTGQRDVRWPSPKSKALKD
jgi:hypothetical protein